MMDNSDLRDLLRGFGDEHCSKEKGSTSSGQSGITHENTQRSYVVTAPHKNIDTLVIDSSAKKKRLSKIIGGLRQFSTIVCKKVESKGRTTCSEVADEIIAHFAEMHCNEDVSLDEFDEKNIQRRVYDALNVLMGMDIITKDKKEIQWNGQPCSYLKDMEEIKAQRLKLMTRVGNKATYMKALEEQIAGLQNLIKCNKQLLKSGKVSSDGFSLPFILVQTSPHAMVEIEISEDMQMVHLDFNSTPFSLHDDAYILKLMRRYELPEGRCVSQSSSTHSSSSSGIASGGTKPFY